MGDLEDAPLPWRKSSKSAQGDCVEVAERDEHVLIRNSNNPEAGMLRVPIDDWRAFIRGVYAGEFDLDH